MKTYECDVCGKIFKQKSHFDNHKKRKNPCHKPVPIISQNLAENLPKKNSEKEYNDTTMPNIVCQHVGENISCAYCGNVFAHKSSLCKHLNGRCKIKKQIDNERECIYNKLLSELQELKQANLEIKLSNQEIIKENKRLRQKMSNMKAKKITYNKTNNTINNGTVINNIKLVAYGREDRTKIDPREIIKALQGYATQVELTKMIHFNDKYPEYHNIYINNLRDKYVMVYDGEWRLKLREGIIDDIYDTNKEYIEENLEEFIKSLDRIRINSLNRWLNTPETSPKIKKIKDEIKLLLYNEREKVTKRIETAELPIMISDQ